MRDTSSAKITQTNQNGTSHSGSEYLRRKPARTVRSTQWELDPEDYRTHYTDRDAHYIESKPPHHI